MIKRCLPVLLFMSLAGCGEDQGSRTQGTGVAFEAAPSPLTAPVMAAGSKTFTNDMMDSITLDKAYIVITNIGIETDCSGLPVFSMVPLLDLLVPTAHAHSSATATDTGAPFIIDVLAQDGLMIDVGELEPLPEDYCGVRVRLAPADDDAANLPVSSGVPNDMVGLTIYIEGSYNGGNPFSVQTGASLPERNMLLSPSVVLDASTPRQTVSIAVQYDTWFTNVDPANINNSILFANIIASLQRM